MVYTYQMFIVRTFHCSKVKTYVLVKLLKAIKHFIIIIIIPFYNRLQEKEAVVPR